MAPDIFKISKANLHPDNGFSVQDLLILSAKPPDLLISLPAAADITLPLNNDGQVGFSVYDYNQSLDPRRHIVLDVTNAPDLLSPKSVRIGQQGSENVWVPASTEQIIFVGPHGFGSKELNASQYLLVDWNGRILEK